MMSVQSGVVTHSSTPSRFTHSRSHDPHPKHPYYELSGSNGWNGNSKSSSKTPIVYPVKDSTNASTLSPSERAHYCRVLGYCTAIIVFGTLMIISRRIQNQTITEYGGEHLRFRHQWIQTWFYFLSKTLLIIVIATPYYNRSFGISQTFHSQILVRHNTSSIANANGDSNSNTRQQMVHCVSALCLVFAQFLLNIALYYMPASIWITMTSIVIVYVSVFKFFHIQPSIMIFVGVFCIITGNIMIMSTQIHELKAIASYNVSTTLFAFISLCGGALFHTIYYMIYSHYYDEFRVYCTMLFKLKTLRKSRYRIDSDFMLRYDIERKNIMFYEWNHFKMLYMEGIYGLLFTSIIIGLLMCLNVEYSWSFYWFYENMKDFVHCVMATGGAVHIAMFVVYIASVMCYDIVLELSKSYLSSFHCKMIFIATVVVVWFCDVSIHWVFEHYGEGITWYMLLEGGALVFIALGICLFDDKYVVYLNGMMEHNGLILKQQRIYTLTKYWNQIYYRKEKERLCGFSPTHLKKEYEYHDAAQDHNLFDVTPNKDDKDQSGRNYQELSINSYNRDGTKLEGTINLLIGDGVSSALTHGPSKYYPALYS
eukprot:54494_1